MQVRPVGGCIRCLLLLRRVFHRSADILKALSSRTFHSERRALLRACFTRQQHKRLQDTFQHPENGLSPGSIEWILRLSSFFATGAENNHLTEVFHTHGTYCGRRPAQRKARGDRPDLHLRYRPDHLAENARGYRHQSRHPRQGSLRE